MSLDWYCGCGEKNFGSRDKCRKCDTFKSKSIGVKKEDKIKAKKEDTDWTCLHCYEFNFQKRDNCFGCKKPKGSRPDNVDDMVEDKEKTCRICYYSPIDCVIKPCGHMAFCLDCATETVNKFKHCPLCKKSCMSSDIIKVFSAF